MSDELSDAVKSSYGWIEMANYTSNPTDTNSNRAGLCIVSGTLKIYDGSSWSSISGGGGGITNWDDLYDADKTLTIDVSTLTFAVTADIDGLTITGSSDVDSGALLQFSGSGNAKDIQGTGDTWSVTKAGVFDGTDATLDSLTVGSGAATGVIDSSGDYNLTLQTGNSTTCDITLVDGGNGDIDMTLNGTGAVNINGTTTHNDALVVAAGDVTISTGGLSITDDQNAESVTIINNTANTLGASSTAGVVQIESTSLTTGALLNLQLTEGTLSGGTYIRAWDATESQSEFEVGESGAVTIAGAGGSNMLTITAGDVSMADGSITAVDADAAVMFELENTNAGATGVQMKVNHNSGSPADNDIIFRLSGYCDDSGGASAENARIDFKALDITAGTEDSEINFQVMTGGSLAEVLSLKGDTAIIGDGSAAGYISSEGAYDLVLETNEGTNAGTITLTDGANGDITFAPNGTGELVFSSPKKWESSTGITADVGSTQGDGAFTEDVLEISTCANSGDAVTLPGAEAGKVIVVINRGANSADVFPASGDNVNESGADTAVAVAANASRMFVGIDATHWESLILARS